MKIVLIGFMGTGKSSVAPLLADKLGLDTVEMDDLIVQRAGQAIADIFAAGGEPAFRALEARVSDALQDRHNVVISTGGGVVMDQTTWEYLSKNAVVVELTATFDTILGRINPAALPRPLFADETQAKALYELREPLYSKYAAIHVATDGRSVEAVASEVAKQLKEIDKP